MSILNQVSIIYLPQSYSVSNRTPIVADIWAADSTDLPSATYFDGYNLCNGCKATCANGDIYRFDGTQWVYNEQSPFQDVYTKSQIDTMLSDIDNDISDLQDVGGVHTRRIAELQEYDENQDKYIYALVGRSDLNLLDSTVWEGQTTAGSGYICQNLAINLPAGEYVWRMTRNGNTLTSFVLKAADDTELYRVNRGAGVNDIVQEFTLTDSAAKISIYAGYSITYYDNMIYSKR